MKILLVAIGLLCLAGCAPESGTVVDRRHEPERKYWDTEQIYTGQTCQTIGQTQSCTPQYTYVPVQRVDDEDWKLKLRSEDDEGWVSVSRSEYKAHPLDSYYDGSGK